MIYFVCLSDIIWAHFPHFSIEMINHMGLSQDLCLASKWQFSQKFCTIVIDAFVSNGNSLSFYIVFVLLHSSNNKKKKNKTNETTRHRMDDCVGAYFSCSRFFFVRCTLLFTHVSCVLNFTVVRVYPCEQWNLINFTMRERKMCETQIDGILFHFILFVSMGCGMTMYGIFKLKIFLCLGIVTVLLRSFHGYDFLFSVICPFSAYFYVIASICVFVMQTEPHNSWRCVCACKRLSKWVIVVCLSFFDIGVAWVDAKLKAS